jgi:hypothetical protein
LEVHLVEALSEGGSKPGDRRQWASRHEGHAEPDDAPDAIRTHERRAPSGAAPEVVADDNGTFLPQLVEEPDQIAHRMQDGVALNRFGPVRPSEAPLVRCHRVVAGVSEG